MTEQHLPSTKAQRLIIKANSAANEYRRAHQLWLGGNATEAEVQEASEDMQAAQIALNKYIKDLENGKAIS